MARIKQFLTRLLWPDIDEVIWYTRQFERAFINANPHP
ncbi:MAG: hypothetical protein FOGNACKC_02194 [Anaerolineae bacterium]|nr:hypothetical protein [Anaerolineae bacterium]